jgi:hypothetical protein
MCDTTDESGLFRPGRQSKPSVDTFFTCRLPGGLVAGEPLGQSSAMHVPTSQLVLVLLIVAVVLGMIALQPRAPR